jgi:hypothetical protein
VRARRHGVADEDSEHAVTTLAVWIGVTSGLEERLRPAAS